MRICVVTGSRAEYGLLYWVLHDLREAAGIELQLVVTGMHLADEFGLTVREIEHDGFAISRRVDMLVAGDTRAAVAKSIARGIVGMSEAIEQLQPQLVLLLGDRFEIFAAAQACLVHRVPLAHIAGGDTTQGANDESMRHAITKMAHVHFVTNEESARRVRQMGEDPQHVHVTGSPGLDHLLRRPLLDRAALESALGARLGECNLLITFHPVTLAQDDGASQFQELLGALEQLDPRIKFWFTLPNADSGGRALGTALRAWVQAHGDRARLYESLGQQRYLSLMALSDVVVGNSSSGLYEAPSLRVPTVNVGDRQEGRLAAESVIHCAPLRAEIAAAIARAMTLDCTRVINPYGDGTAARRIVEVLRTLPPTEQLLKKTFHVPVHAHD